MPEAVRNRRMGTSSARGYPQFGGMQRYLIGEGVTTTPVPCNGLLSVLVNPFPNAAATTIRASSNAVRCGLMRVLRRVYLSNETDFCGRYFTSASYSSIIILSGIFGCWYIFHQVSFLRRGDPTSIHLSDVC